MNFLTKFQKEEKAVCIYLSLGVLFFLFFDYSISKFFYNINSQTKSLFETLTHFGDSLYFFVPTILIWAVIKIIQNKNKIILTFSDISLFIFFEEQCKLDLSNISKSPIFHLKINSTARPLRLFISS